jgi:predicted MFS family arabinose efflux permease
MDILKENTSKPELSGGTVLLMAVASGLFVASIYYNQPMLGILAGDFHVGADGISGVAVATQIGYAVGLLFLSSLGDCLERRRLIFVTAVALSLSLAWAALATGLWGLVAASFCVGALATVAQQVVPMAAHLAPPNQRGRVLGTVMAGLLAGILLARTVSGVVSEYASWREMFWLASAASLAMGAVLAVRLPRSVPENPISYGRILVSLAGLWRRHKTLRRASLVQTLLFGSFVSFWTNVALFLEQPPFSQGSSVAGLLGLLGLAGVLAAPVAGRLADRGGRGPARVVACGAGLVALSFVLMEVFPTSWSALFAGIVLLDIGLQAAMLSNQTRVYALDAAARSRLNTVYMTAMFTGGALGSAVGAQAFARFGWSGVCLMGVACGLLALAVEVLPGPAGRP